MSSLNSRLKDECEELVRQLLRRHACLQPMNKQYDVWDASDAKEIVRDLIILLNRSEAITTAHYKIDWGK